MARLGGRQRRARGHPQLHRLHAGRADAAGAGRAGAVLDAARLGAAVAGARPGGSLRASSRARLRRALAFGRLSAEDAAVFCALAEEAIGAMRPLEDYIEHPELLPQADAARWFILNCIRQHVRDGTLRRFQAAHGQPLPAQPAARASAHAAYRSGRTMGRARRRSTRCSTLLKKVTEPMTPADARRHRPIATRRLRAHREAGCACSRCRCRISRGSPPRCASTLDERRADHGRVRVRALVANPAFAARLNDNELVFVLAHELLHLALRTHDRASGSGRLEFNYAHDYIINDILRVELGRHRDPGRRARHARRARAIGRGDRARDAPQWPTHAVAHARLGRRDRHGARRVRRPAAGRRCRNDGPIAGADDGGTCSTTARTGIVPGRCGRTGAADAAHRGACRARACARQGHGRACRGAATTPARPQQVVTALRGHLPHALADGAAEAGWNRVAPGERTFARPSRRGADRADVVLPGRKREVLDAQRHPRHHRLDDRRDPARARRHRRFLRRGRRRPVRLVQCDAEITADELLSPDELAHYRSAATAAAT